MSQTEALCSLTETRFIRTSQAGPGSHERILISLGQNPFSDFLAFTGEISLEGFFRRNSGILNLDKEGQNLAEYLLDGAAKRTA